MSKVRSSTLPLVRFLIDPRLSVAQVAEIWAQEYPDIDGCTPANPRHKAALQLRIKPHVPT